MFELKYDEIFIIRFDWGGMVAKMKQSYMMKVVEVVGFRI